MNYIYIDIYIIHTLVGANIHARPRSIIQLRGLRSPEAVARRGANVINGGRGPARPGPARVGRIGPPVGGTERRRRRRGAIMRSEHCCRRAPGAG